MSRGHMPPQFDKKKSFNKDFRTLDHFVYEDFLCYHSIVIPPPQAIFWIRHCLGWHHLLDLL